MILPQFLEKGNTIAIASPAAALQDSSIIEKATSVLESWDLKVKIAPNCFNQEGYYAGNCKIRKKDFLSLLTDKEIKAILCSYGGYGCIHLVEEFSTAIQTNPKWVIGMSDCSILHAAALNAEVMSLHAPQCRHISMFPNSEATSMLRNILFGNIPCYKINGHELNITGKARGILAGGNLSVLCSLVRTPYDILNPNIILFIEDLNEPFYKIERMIYSLKLSGILERVSALIVGEFIGIKDCARFNDSVYDMIHRITKKCNIPVCFNFPVGHGENNMPLIEGAEVEIKITTNETQLSYMPHRLL